MNKIPINKYEGDSNESSINRYEVVYGNLFVCKRIVWATSENNVVEYCKEKYPNIFPLKEINLLEENVNQ